MSDVDQVAKAVRVEKWDDDLAVRLPEEIVAFLGLKDGDEVEIGAVAPGMVEICRLVDPPSPPSFSEWSNPDDDEAFRNL